MNFPDYRITGLLKTGAMKEQDKPIWYDVYKIFPPKYEPAFTRAAVEKEIKPIFYPEDNIRGKFFELYGFIGTYNLLTPDAKSLAQRYVEKYQLLENSGKFSREEDLLKAVESALEAEGISLVRKQK
ncbi:28S ribosomal protein S23, mitochondrial-like isoform X2 [Stegodyphus dumicola]|uniref:28S ribosomal protein S23, mitochondrial-like isoform X2 n=1 Tax=Stegodyphus dumicola TaxID=202533 RepID=UPI0015AD7C65|nr:28S ribosomal protein S23, mitochondrial-like isoform X2 [Stegodyphus dumicola]